MKEIIELNDSQNGVAAADPARTKMRVGSFYDYLAANSASLDYWNWGLHSPETHNEASELVPGYDRHFSDGYSEQLYLHILRMAPEMMAGRPRILEVGSGLGRGANFVSRAFDVSELIGLDLSPHAVELANAKFKRPGLEFRVGDAENMPFSPGEFDLVINVESSHNYPNFNKFLDEVSRVLKPGGYLAHVDIFTEARLRQAIPLLNSHPQLELLREDDVSDLVRAAIKRRLEPDSFIRARYRERTKSWMERLVGERIFLASFGGVFTDYQFDLPTRLLMNSGAMPMVNVAAYVAHCARKRPTAA